MILRFFDTPRRLRIAGTASISCAALLGLTAALFRDQGNSGTGAYAATYLLDTAGWLITCMGAIAFARLGAIYFRFQPRSVRRAAVLATATGIFLSLLSCVVLSVADGSPLLLRLVAAALLIAGLGIGLAGLATLAITDGGRYAADRLAHLDE